MARPAAHSCGELSQHVMKYPAIVEVFELVNRIEASDQRHALDLAVGGGYLGMEGLPRRKSVGETANGDGLVALDAELPPRHSLLEDERQDAHADEIGTVDAFEALG